MSAAAGLELVLRWGLASALGFMAGFGALPQTLAALPRSHLLAVSIAGLLLGAGLGAGQVFLSSRSLPRPGLWIVATAAGGAIGLPSSLAITLPLWHVLPYKLAPIAGGMILGLILGIAQRPALPAGPLGGSAWLLASSLSAALAFWIAAGYIPPLPLSLHSSAQMAALGALSGSIYGVASALPLHTLLSKSNRVSSVPGSPPMQTASGSTTRSPRSRARR